MSSFLYRLDGRCTVAAIVQLPEPSAAGTVASTSIRRCVSLIARSLPNIDRGSRARTQRAWMTDLPKRSIVSSRCARLSPGSPTCSQVTPSAACFSTPLR